MGICKFFTGFSLFMTVILPCWLYRDHSLYVLGTSESCSNKRNDCFNFNDFTEYLRWATAKKRGKEKWDRITAGKFLQEKWKLVFTFVLTSCCRYPHHDVHVQWSARVRVHPVSATDRPVSLPWTLLRRSLHLGRLPPTALREAPGAEDEQRFAGWSVPQGESHFARVQSCQVPQTK